MSCASEAPRNLNFIVQLPLHRSHTWQVDVRGHESKSHRSTFLLPICTRRYPFLNFRGLIHRTETGALNYM